MHQAELDRLYEVARSDGVAVDRTGRGLLRLDGPQAIWFLQQTITADVEDLPSGAWRESAFLTPKGKLVSHFRVGVAGGDAGTTIWLDIDPPPGDLADWLIKYRFRTKVEIEDRTTSVTTVIGPPAAELAGDGEIVVGVDGVIFGSRLGDVDVADVHGSLHGAGLEAAPLDVYEMFRIEAGVARFGTDYGTDHLPQEAGLTSIVPVDKGCYVGQETVARIHFRGHVNRVVRPLRLEGIEPLDAVGKELSLNGARVGAITSSARTPRSGVVAIGMVRVEPSEGAELEITDGGTAILGPVPEGTKVKAG